MSIKIQFCPIRSNKVNFARFYNRRHHRRGYFWGERFKSVIVENRETLINGLAYINLKPKATFLSPPSWSRPETL